MKNTSYFQSFKHLFGIDPYSQSFFHYRNLQNMRFMVPLLGLDLLYLATIHFYEVHNRQFDLCHFLVMLFYFIVGITLYILRHDQEKYERTISVFVDAFVFIRLIIAYYLAVELDPEYFILPFYLAVLWSFALLNIKPFQTLFIVFLIYINIRFFNKNYIHVEFLMKSRYIIASLIIISFSKYHNFLHTARLYENLYYISHVDQLSGVQNRHSLQEKYDDFLDKTLFIVMADIDDFKLINDTYGHTKGDEVIKVFAETITKVFKKGNCFRFGGDEFLVIMEYDEKTSHLLDDYREKVKDIHIDQTNISPQFSLGYTGGYCKTREDIQRMIIRADEYLYQAKKEGKNKIVGDFV